MTDTIRPTKKQRELLNFIEQFISEHGYSPSFREIMNGLNYTSVATVALHVNNLIKRGHLRKRDHSARSLEVVRTEDSFNPSTVATRITSNTIAPNEEKWLIEKIEHFFAEAERAGEITQDVIDQLHVLNGALRVLGMEGAAQSFMPRLTELKKRLSPEA
jgi:SOS-response transcriptional repressor LexA